MKILVTGTEGSGIDQVERLLKVAGHELVSCHEPGEARGACQRCHDPASCPAAAGVDVIVAARQHPLPHLTPHERSTECILLADVPLVIAGSTVLNPFGERATVFIEGFDDVVEACAEATAEAPRRRAVSSA